MKVSVVVPVFNSEQIIEQLVSRLESTMETCAEDYEVILINDGSRDGSWQKIKNLSLSKFRVVGINLMRNFGQHNALLCGVRHAKFPITVTIDDDLQNPPEEIPKLLSKLSEGYDVVYGAREKEQHGIWRNLSSQITKLVLTKGMGAEVSTKICSYRAFKTDLRNAFTDYKSNIVFLDVLLTWGTSKFTATKVSHKPREIGQSNYGFRKLVAHAINLITGFSVIPLQFASLNGIACTALGFLLLGYVLLMFFAKGGAPAGFPFLASIVLIFSGAQLLSIGIIGEYIARIHIRLQDRPAYGISEYSKHAEEHDGKHVEEDDGGTNFSPSATPIEFATTAN